MSDDDDEEEYEFNLIDEVDDTEEIISQIQEQIKENAKRADLAVKTSRKPVNVVPSNLRSLYVKLFEVALEKRYKLEKGKKKIEIVDDKRKHLITCIYKSLGIDEDIEDTVYVVNENTDKYIISNNEFVCSRCGSNNIVIESSTKTCLDCFNSEELSNKVTKFIGYPTGYPTGYSTGYSTGAKDMSKTILGFTYYFSGEKGFKGTKERLIKKIREFCDMYGIDNHDKYIMEFNKYTENKTTLSQRTLKKFIIESILNDQRLSSDEEINEYKVKLIDHFKFNTKYGHTIVFKKVLDVRKIMGYNDDLINTFIRFEKKLISSAESFRKARKNVNWIVSNGELSDNQKIALVYFVITSSKTVSLQTLLDDIKITDKQRKLSSELSAILDDKKKAVRF